MHRTKPSRARMIVPSALAVVILTGAAAPAGAADGEGAAARTERAATVQRQIEKVESRAAAGPIDDLLAGLTKTIEDLLKSVGGLLPGGITLPPIQLPKLPDLNLPDLSDIVPKLPVELPPLDGVAPDLPAVPLVPPADTAPELPGAVPLVPPADTAPELPGVPELPDAPEIPDIPEIPEIPDLP
ncbi:hypothetical protein OG625_23085 [Streptomyces sp. NBC_01351]|uniref:hypothetical protein n=1 Tax=Streptomyces sp. NBC_01351 TaxID=2903833 RepID=UPI002E31A1B9|nr:hypothetical protein [Streptomyces sp. NBC_01351]